MKTERVMLLHLIWIVCLLGIAICYALNEQEPNIGYLILSTYLTSNGLAAKGVQLAWALFGIDVTKP